MAKRAFMLAMVFFLSACATTTFVEHKPHESRQTLGVTVTAAPHAAVPDGLISNIKQSIEQQLYSVHGYDKTNEVSVMFKVLESDNERGFWASWWNKSSTESVKKKMNVGVIYSDSFDTQLAEIAIEIDVGTGRFQSSQPQAIKSIALQVAEYTKKFFPNSR